MWWLATVSSGSTGGMFPRRRWLTTVAKAIGFVAVIVSVYVLSLLPWASSGLERFSAPPFEKATIDGDGHRLKPAGDPSSALVVAAASHGAAASAFALSNQNTKLRHPLVAAGGVSDVAVPHGNEVSVGNDQKAAAASSNYRRSVGSGSTTTTPNLCSKCIGFGGTPFDVVIRPASSSSADKAPSPEAHPRGGVIYVPSNEMLQCPLMWMRQRRTSPQEEGVVVRHCAQFGVARVNSSMVPPGAVPGPVRVALEGQISRLLKQPAALAVALQDVCTWPGLSSSVELRWPFGDRIREALAPHSLRDVVDCVAHEPTALASRPGESANYVGTGDHHDAARYEYVATCHHLPSMAAAPASFELPLKLGVDADLNARRQKLSSLPYSDVRSMPQSYSGYPSKSPKSQDVSIGRASWLHLKGVCLTFEAKGQWFMNAKRPRHPTLWSVGADLPIVKAAARKGRHKIFLDREGAFQYGGILPVDDHPASTVVTLAGTTLLASPFDINNVGHEINDGGWGYSIPAAVEARARNASKDRQGGMFPMPFRMLVDSQFYRRSGKMYAFMAEIGARAWLELGAPGRSSSSRLDGSGVIVNPLSYEDLNLMRHAAADMPSSPGENGASSAAPGTGSAVKVLCFDHLVITGNDRNGFGARKVSRTAVANTIRATAFRALRLSPALYEGNVPRLPKVFVYGRHDVHRRSIDNYGELVHKVTEITASFGLEKPVVIPSFTTSAFAQVELFSQIDVLVTMQGAHMQTSLFMPADGVLVEIAPCRSKRTSFVSRYGMFLPSMVLRQLMVCSPVINLDHEDKRSQNVTLCGHHLVELEAMLREELKGMAKRRGVELRPRGGG